MFFYREPRNKPTCLIRTPGNSGSVTGVADLVGSFLLADPEAPLESDHPDGDNNPEGAADPGQVFGPRQGESRRQRHSRPVGSGDAVLGRQTILAQAQVRDAAHEDRKTRGPERRDDRSAGQHRTERQIEGESRGARLKKRCSIFEWVSVCVCLSFYNVVNIEAKIVVFTLNLFSRCLMIH